VILTPKNPIFCAIDGDNLAYAQKITNEIGDVVGGVKLGLEYFVSCGPNGVAEIVKQNIPVFLDLKLHDIPNTVSGAVKSATKLGVSMLTIHASGGADMMKAASYTAETEADKLGVVPPLLLAVTVLTSFSFDDMKQTGIEGDVKSQVLRLAELSLKSGVKGIVCSPLEITILRENFGNDLIIVTPGIRPSGANIGDQKRVMTPKEAIACGADYLVIGRPITESKNPNYTLQEILKEC
jgi:orotidine-5'-phosphate decarboxylase